jgi:methyl-accepting chemotaxis protein
MRLFLDLSVGRKLAASASLALLLMAVLVALVWSETGRIAEAQHEQARLATTADGIEAAADILRDVPVLERELLLTNDAAGQQQAGQAMLARLDAGMTDLVAAVTAHGEPEMRAALAGAQESATRYRAALATLAETRARLIAVRDAQLFGQSTDYDSIFEAVSSGLAFELEGDLEEDARQRLLTLHAAVNDLRFGMQRLLVTGEEAQVRRTRRGIAQARVHGRGLANMDVPRRAKDEFGRLAARADGLAQAAEELLATSEVIAAHRRDAVQPARQEMQQRLSDLTAIASRIAADQQAGTQRSAEAVRDGTIWAGIAVALVVLLSGVVMARSVGAPLRRLAAAMGGIAAGDARVVVPDRGRRDEIGIIAQSLETLRATADRAFAQGQMLEQLPTAVMNADPRDGFRITYMNAETRQLLDRLAHLMPCPPDQMLGQSIDIFHRHPEHQRTLLSDPSRLPHTTRIRLGEEVLELRISAIRDGQGEYTGAMLSWTVATEKARLADTFEREVGAVVEAVANSAERLQASARALRASAETSGEEAATVAEAGSRATGDVQSVAAAAEEMAASVAEISRRVGEAAEVAGRAVAEARATDATVQGLSEAATRIGDVVRLIGDIAGQTNLLALNATIEAARAGEAGKGFAVVAGEVKSLAGQTARATDEIARQIAEMQAATQQAVGAIRGIGATVARTSEIATAIAAAVEQQGATTQEIARSAAQVAEATDTVASRIAGVRSAAEATGGAASALSDDSAALAGQAAALREKAGGFLNAVRAA